MDPLVAAVARFAEREKLFRGARNVMVALSGGPDSLATLLCLLDLRERFGFEVSAVHFDHQLRPGSAHDRAWVADFCSSRGVPCFTGEGDVAAFARAQRLGTEDAARRMRYQFMAFIAAEKRADCLATGHTADDQAETVLMRVLRGTGIRGLRGMLPSSGVPGAEAQRLVRPLLETRREATVALCVSRGVTPLLDASNTDPAFTRNLLRLETLPALQHVNPAVSDALLGLASSAQQVFRDVERASFGVQPLVRGPVGSIFDLPAMAALLNEAITLAIEREAAFYKLDFQVNRTRIENLRTALKARTGSVSFGDVAVEASAGKLRVGPPLAAGTSFALRLRIPGVASGSSWKADVRPAATDSVAAPGVVRIAASEAMRGLSLRTVRPGDRMQRHGHTRKVADLYSAERVPTWERSGAVAIANGERVLALLTASGVFEADRNPNAAAWDVFVGGA